MAQIIELQSSDVLVVRRAESNAPFEGELESWQEFSADVGIKGVLVLGPDENLTTLSDETLKDVGLQRLWPKEEISEMVTRIAERIEFAALNPAHAREAALVLINAGFVR